VANKQRTPDSELLLAMALEAGKIGLKYFKSKNDVWYKEGNSPVSQADKEIDDYLRKGFLKERQHYGWLSEETEDNEKRLECDRVIIADPIDGTRGFIEGRDEWCISIAIVENSRPIEAILHCPALKRTFLASKGNGLELICVQGASELQNGKPLVTGSKKLIETIRTLPEAPFDVMEFIPSLAYRLAMVAIGELDGAFARGGASEWDVAAADLILEETGCLLSDIDQQEIRYNQTNVKVPALIATHNNRYEEIFGLAKQAGFLH
jgi:myo-inositol-1(or 4)-monophosphatase